MDELETHLYSCLRNAVRAGINVSRLADYCQERFHTELGVGKKIVGHVSAIDTGGQTTISGSGEIFEKFKRTGELNGYAGCGQTPKTFFEPGYKTAPVRYMNLDETYHRMPYDCRDSKSVNKYFRFQSYVHCDVFDVFPSHDVFH